VRGQPDVIGRVTNGRHCYVPWSGTRAPQKYKSERAPDKGLSIVFSSFDPSNWYIKTLFLINWSQIVTRIWDQYINIHVPKLKYQRIKGCKRVVNAPEITKYADNDKIIVCS
jgi:hypothetical protein